MTIIGDHPRTMNCSEGLYSSFVYLFQDCGVVKLTLWVLIVTELIGLSMIGSKEYNLIINKNYLQVSNIELLKALNLTDIFKSRYIFEIADRKE